jgi:hypothetical protein
MGRLLKNRGRTTDAINKMVISGKPRINSIYTTDKNLMTGIFDWRPNANNTPIGNEATIPAVATTIVNIKPPHLCVSTISKLSPPYSKNKAIIG